MKNLRSLTTLVALVALACASASADRPRNLLFYGNSFTQGVGSTEAQSFGGVPAVVRQLAAYAGYITPNVEDAAVGGQSLAWHIANNTGSIAHPTDFAGAPDFQWDAVVLQEYSTIPTHIGNPTAFRADALTLSGLVRSHSPAAKVTLYETWARGPGHSYYTGTPPTFPGGPAQMQQELRDNYNLAFGDLKLAYGADNVLLARVGDAWEATGWANLHATDIYHANTRGTYLAGLVMFGTLYGERTTVGLPKIFTSLTVAEATALQTIADQYLPPGMKFDADADHDVDAADLAALPGCLNGPGMAYGPGAACGYMDGNEDSSVDVRDYALMQTSALVLPTALTCELWDMTFSLPTGSGTDTQDNAIVTSDNSAPMVTLSAVDLATHAAPTWLTVPATTSAMALFPVSVNVAGVAPGTYWARVTVTAPGYDVTSFTVQFTAVASGVPQTLFFDFGDPAQVTTGNYNNVLYQQAPVPNAIDSTGASTGISLTVTDSFWPGSNQNGTTAPTGDAALFDVQATRDNLFGCTVTFGGYVEPTAAVTLGGLSTTPGVTYSFTFFASRTGVSDNREAKYEVIGATSGVGLLNASNNTTQVVTVPYIAANASGQILIKVSPGPNNNNASGFYYLGALKVTRTP